jgi:Domain of unknown function (DUF6265)
MKKIPVPVFAILIVLLFTAAANKSSVTKLDWLKGSWIMKKKNGGVVMESWQQFNDSTLTGESLNFSASGHSTVMETLQLVYRNHVYHYISTVKGQNNNEPVAFTVTALSENSFMAENPEHDFPKRISYRLVTKDSIHAFIDGGPAMPEKKINFYYSRYKN